LQRNSCMSTDKGTSVWNFVPNSELRKISQLLTSVASLSPFVIIPTTVCDAWSILPTVTIPVKQHRHCPFYFSSRTELIMPMVNTGEDVTPVCLLVVWNNNANSGRSSSVGARTSTIRLFVASAFTLQQNRKHTCAGIVRVWSINQSINLTALTRGSTAHFSTNNSTNKQHYVTSTAEKKQFSSRDRKL